MSLRFEAELTPELRKQCTTAVNALMRHKFAGPFLQPVDPVALGIPDYFKVVTRPMDLSTVSNRLRNVSEPHYYTRYEEFVDDTLRIFSNCLLYNNTPGDEVIRNMAVALRTQFETFLSKQYKAHFVSGFNAGLASDAGSAAPTSTPSKGKRARTDIMAATSTPAATPAPAPTLPPAAARAVSTGTYAMLPAPEDGGMGEDEDDDNGTGVGGKRAPILSNEASKWDVSDPHHAFWVNLETTWDDMGMPASQRRSPLIGARPLDLYEFFAEVMTGGGYDGLSRTKGGWLNVYRRLQLSRVSESSISSRMKRIYERMLLELERRLAAGWTTESEPRPYPVLTVAEGFVYNFLNAPKALAVASMGATGGGVGGAGEEGTAGVDAVASEATTVRATAQELQEAQAAAVTRELKRVKLAVPPPNSFPYALAGPALPLLPPTTIKYLSVSPLIAASLSTRALTLPSATASIMPPAPSSSAAGLRAAAALPREVVDDHEWSVARASRILSQYEYAGSKAFAGATFSSASQGGGNVATTTPVSTGGAGGSQACMTCGRAKCSAASVAAAAAATAAAERTQESGVSPEDVAALGGAALMQGSAATAGARAVSGWASCAACHRLQCFACLAPSAAYMGGDSTEEEERQRMLDTAAVIAESGSCGAGGVANGVESGLWFCSACTAGHTPTFATLPWCASCSAPLRGAAMPRDTSYFNAASQPCDAVPWPAQVTCVDCGASQHGVCAARSGTVALRVQATATDVGVSSAQPSGSPTSASTPSSGGTDLQYAYVCYGCAGARRAGGAALLSDAAASVRLPAPGAATPRMWHNLAVTREIMVTGRLL